MYVASCLRILFGSRQYCRYLKHTQSEGKGLMRRRYVHSLCTVHAAECKMSLRRSKYKQWENKQAWYQCYSPVQQPGLFGAGQSVHELIGFWSDGGILIHGPSKVPLIHSSCCNCTAVHCRLQVGTYSGRVNKDDKELKVVRAVNESGRSSMKWLMRMEDNENTWIKVKQLLHLASLGKLDIMKMRRTERRM